MVTLRRPSLTLSQFYSVFTKFRDLSRCRMDSKDVLLVMYCCRFSKTRPISKKADFRQINSDNALSFIHRLFRSEHNPPSNIRTKRFSVHCYLLRCVPPTGYREQNIPGAVNEMSSPFFFSFRYFFYFNNDNTTVRMIYRTIIKNKKNTYTGTLHQ